MQTTVPPGHGYIETVGGSCYYWRIETLWEAAVSLPVEFATPPPPDRIEAEGWLPWKEQSHP